MLEWVEGVSFDILWYVSVLGASKIRNKNAKVVRAFRVEYS